MSGRRKMKEKSMRHVFSDRKQTGPTDPKPQHPHTSRQPHCQPESAQAQDTHYQDIGKEEKFSEIFDHSSASPPHCREVPSSLFYLKKEEDNIPIIKK
jgi:hypothetical protein